MNKQISMQKSESWCSKWRFNEIFARGFQLALTVWSAHRLTAQADMSRIFSQGLNFLQVRG